MLAAIYIKPELLIIQKSLEEILNHMLTEEQTPEGRATLEAFKEGVRILAGTHEGNPSPMVLHVETGTMTKELLLTVDTTSYSNESKSQYMENYYVGNPYGLIILDLPYTDPEKMSSKLKELKGRKYRASELPEDFKHDQPHVSADYPAGYGMRYGIRRAYYGLRPEELYDVNRRFLHTPDTQAEAEAVYRYVTEGRKEFEGTILYDAPRESGNLEGVK